VNLFDKIQLLGHALRWRLTWDRRDTAYRPAATLPAKFVSARAAVDRIGDAACIISSGFAGNARCSILFWALRERFEATGRPRNLTWISVAAQGGRGRVPGTVEEVGIEGLVTRYVSGHTETAKSMLRLADAGKLELHTLPQGEMAHIIEAQGRGVNEVRCRTGAGTFLDPRVGRGSPVTGGAHLQLVRADGDDLVYTLPAINVAFINAPYADRDGNIYFANASTISENTGSARAARQNAGLVIVAVSGLVDRDDACIALPAECVDAIVVNPGNEQAGSVPQQKYWEMFTAGAKVDALRANDKLRFLNRTLGITPRRTAADLALARLGARTFTRAVAPGATVNVGVGLAEEICLELFKSEARDSITFTTESGPYGGLPASGIFFGAAINPLRLESSAWMFHHYYETLDAALLGFLELDSMGNINLSKRGPRMLDYVGPGGAPSIIEAAKTVLFAGRWMQGARISVHGERLQVDEPGLPKLVEQVNEVTFNGQVGLDSGKRIFYVTDLALLELTDAGLTLRSVMPGIDIERDLLANAEARILVPDDPAPETVPAAVVTGEGFHLNLTGQVN
jgi:propionate CoA-transferase